MNPAPASNADLGSLFGATIYPSALKRLVDDAPQAPLDSGVPNESARAALDSLKPADLFAPRPVSDPQAAQACMAGLWLLHGFLERARQAILGVATPEGIYWQALLLRREGNIDACRAAFESLSAHPVYATLGWAARAYAETAGISEGPLAALRQETSWNPTAFAQACPALLKAPADEVSSQASLGLAVRIQKLEWDMLFDHCYRKAMG